MYSKKTSIYYLLVLTLLVVGRTNCQSTHTASIELGYPVPQSKYTFQNVWEGMYNINVGYSYHLTKKLKLKTLFHYARFRINQEKLMIKSNYYFFGPAVGLEYSLPFWKNYLPQLSVGGGYMWMRFMNPEIPNRFVQRYNTTSWYLIPQIALIKFPISTSYVSIQLGYPIIFSDIFEENNGIHEEESTIRYISIALVGTIPF